MANVMAVWKEFNPVTNFASDSWDFETTAFKEKVRITLPRKLAMLYEENSCPLNDTACSYYADLFGLDETSDPGLVAYAVSKAITEELLVLCDKECSGKLFKMEAL